MNYTNTKFFLIHSWHTPPGLLMQTTKMKNVPDNVCSDFNQIACRERRSLVRVFHIGVTS